MKATRIVRRIKDLGRLVIPKKPEEYENQKGKTVIYLQGQFATVETEQQQIHNSV